MTTHDEQMPGAETAAELHEDEEDRAEWVEHLVPLQFLRVLWNGVFPSRFRKLVLDAVSGTPPLGDARPFTFCLGCWLLVYSVASTFSTDHGIENALQVLPAVERHQVAQRLGIDTMVVIPDTGKIALDTARGRVAQRVRQVTGKRFHNISAVEIATYLEKHGDKELGLRVRGFASLDEHDEIVGEGTIVLFVVFGLVPGWWLAHRVLASPRRSFRETRYVYMYNDSWLLVFFVCPMIMMIATNEAFSSGVPMNVLIGICLAALLVWIVRTPRLFRATHDASLWRVAIAQLCVIVVAFAVFFAVAIGRGTWAVTLEHVGF
ncbi:MAG TPA: hypothetical protein VGM82_07215 [Gemmatimonadaceae bacterium]|jgi:hypothetical protein